MRSIWVSRGKKLQTCVTRKLIPIHYAASPEIKVHTLPDQEAIVLKRHWYLSLLLLITGGLKVPFLLTLGRSGYFQHTAWGWCYQPLNVNRPTEWSTSFAETVVQGDGHLMTGKSYYDWDKSAVHFLDLGRSLRSIWVSRGKKLQTCVTRKLIPICSLNFYTASSEIKVHTSQDQEAIVLKRH